VNPPAKPPVPTRETAPASAAAAKIPAAADVSKAAETGLWQEPAGPGYYLKIAAYRDRAQAETLAKRLHGKGYHTYVVTAPGGLHSVRVGKYKTRKEADTVRRRLEKEEQLNPLISH